MEEEEEKEKELELEDIETSDGDLVEVADPSLQLRSDLATLLQTPQDLNARPLAPDSVETSYVSALCALYDDQAVAGLNAHPHPRGKGLKTLVERLRID
jgi:hypothetical protein